MQLNFKYLLLLPSFAFAANKVGNGGNIVKCKNSVVLLDFYENAVEPKSELKDPVAIAEQQFVKLQKVNAKLGKQYSSRLKEISSEIDYKEDIELTSIDDSNHLFTPRTKDCKVHQAAIRRNLIVKDEKRFLIRKDLWNKLAPIQQAGLLAHEIIYEHLSKLGEQDSIKARKLNSYLFAGEVKQTEFWKMIKDMRLPIYP